MGVKFGMEEGTFGPLHAKFHPHRCNVSPLRGEKPQNRPLSKLNTGRFALRAMLPVIRKKETGRESTVGRICEMGRFEAGSERVRELYENGEPTEEDNVTGIGRGVERGESELERLG